MVFKYNEDSLIEQLSIEIFQSLRYSYENCFHEIFGEKGTLGRDTSTDVIFIPKLREALLNLNPDIPNEAIEQAIDELACYLLLPKLISREIDVEKTYA